MRKKQQLPTMLDEGKNPDGVEDRLAGKLRDIVCATGPERECVKRGEWRGEEVGLSLKRAGRKDLTPKEGEELVGLLSKKEVVRVPALNRRGHQKVKRRSLL